MSDLNYEEKAAEEIRELIRRTRKRQGIRLKDLAETVGLSTASLSNIECGRQNPSFTTVMKIANQLGLVVVFVPARGKKAAALREARETGRMEGLKEAQRSSL